jgi:hypothetical protein
MDALSNLLSGNRRKKSSVERLNALYCDLLHQIDISKEEHAGRRGVQEDIFPSTKASRLSLAWSLNILRESQSNPVEEDHRTAQRKRDLSAALLRLMAATRSADKEGRNGGAVSTRDLG